MTECFTLANLCIVVVINHDCFKKDLTTQGFLSLRNIRTVLLFVILAFLKMISCFITQYKTVLNFVYFFLTVNFLHKSVVAIEKKKYKEDSIEIFVYEFR